VTEKEKIGPETRTDDIKKMSLIGKYEEVCRLIQSKGIK
jgi:hypothetical protein